MDRALAYAEDIAATARRRRWRSSRRRRTVTPMRDVVDASDRAEKLMHESLLRPDVIEGITSFLREAGAELPAPADRSRNDNRHNDIRPQTAAAEGTR